MLGLLVRSGLCLRSLLGGMLTGNISTTLEETNGARAKNKTAQRKSHDAKH